MHYLIEFGHCLVAILSGCLMGIGLIYIIKGQYFNSALLLIVGLAAGVVNTIMAHYQMLIY